MRTRVAHLTIDGVNVEVHYKGIKNLYIRVYPPDGAVRVSAPRRTGEGQIRRAVTERMRWIERKRDEIRQAERRTPRAMVTGERHHVSGVSHRLVVVHRTGRPRVDIRGGDLVLSVPDGTDASTRRAALDDWYRERLRSDLPGLISRWEPIVGRPVTWWGIRRMTSRWGSCTCRSGRIRFNLELAKVPPRCLEYVVVHELAHLVECNHGPRFVALMDRLLPDWRALREELNRGGRPDGR